MILKKVKGVYVQLLPDRILMYSLQVIQEALDEVTTISGVMSVGDDYLPKSVRGM